MIEQEGRAIGGLPLRQMTPLIMRRGIQGLDTWLLVAKAIEICATGSILCVASPNF
jgi:hypothetical protein